MSKQKQHDLLHFHGGAIQPVSANLLADSVESSITHVVNKMKPAQDECRELLKPYKKGSIPKDVTKAVSAIRKKARKDLEYWIQDASNKYGIPVDHIMLVGQFKDELN